MACYGPVVLGHRFGDEKDRGQDGRRENHLFYGGHRHHLTNWPAGLRISSSGPDHHGYIARMSGPGSIGVWPGKPEILIAQQINLIKDGKPYKMSKRRGEFITMRDLEEVGNDVARGT